MVLARVLLLTAIAYASLWLILNAISSGVSLMERGTLMPCAFMIPSSQVTQELLPSLRMPTLCSGLKPDDNRCAATESESRSVWAKELAFHPSSILVFVYALSPYFSAASCNMVIIVLCIVVSPKVGDMVKMFLSYTFILDLSRKHNEKYSQINTLALCFHT